VTVLLALAGLVFALFVGSYVALSIAADAALLVDAGGWWMLGLYGVVPALVALHARYGRT